MHIPNIALLSQEIKELAEKRRHLDDGQGVLTLSVAAPYMTRVAAELTYDYKDRYLPQSSLYLLLTPTGTFPLVRHQCRFA